MYTALLLMPWMAIYAVSTLIMQRHDFVASLYQTKAPDMIVERELDYSRAFLPNTPPAEMAEQILHDLELDGAHRVSGGDAGKPLTIDRQQATTLRRITYDSAGKRITIQRERFRMNTYLEKLHRRHGYAKSISIEDGWAVAVDAVSIAMFFWCISGVWLWWELRPTRLIGGLFLGAGMALFVIFLLWI